MTHEERLPDDMDGDDPVDETPAGDGSEGETSDPAAGGAEDAGDVEDVEDVEGLTVDDILASEQTEEASEADGEAEATGAGDPDSHLDDLRRLTAEYANYRKRTEANAVLDKQRATAAAVSGLLSVLDDLDLAEEHGDLVEGSAFATIAQKIRGALERMGLESYGEKGEEFDPQMHEAVAQVPVPGTETPQVLDVIQRGYRIGDVELRPAKVAVAVGADG